MLSFRLEKEIAPNVILISFWRWDQKTRKRTQVCGKEVVTISEVIRNSSSRIGTRSTLLLALDFNSWDKLLLLPISHHAAQ